MPRINPAILSWARETAGLSLQEAAAKIQLRDAHGKTGGERLAALEAGDGDISRPILLRMAKQYRRPLVAFYLSKPPRRGDRGSDFRTVHGAERSAAVEGLVDALVRDIRSRQGIVRSVLDEEEAEPLPFVASVSMQLGKDIVAERICQALHFDLSVYRKQASMDAAFSWLRSKAEDAGIYVLLLGNLGSHHTSLDVDAFRGFAIADPVAPFVVINDQDARPAWSFTLIHEIVHVVLGQSGISGAGSDTEVEQFCNDVASSILLPDSDLKAFKKPDAVAISELASAIGQYSAARKVSATMAAYRLRRHRVISDGEWRELRRFFLAAWKRGEAMRKAREADKDGPSFFVVRRHRLGGALVSLMRRTVSDGVVTPTRAAKVLGVKPRSVYPLLGMTDRNSVAA